MAREIPAGTTNEITVTVTPDMSPPHLAEVKVLSTPAMINLMEQCALQAMRPYLEEDETSVGTEVCITHDAALAVGQQATVRARLQSVEGRRYVWEVEALGPDGRKLGGGTHKRAVVNMSRLRGR
jgi:fluoroacetyl-CoA thioesterase